MIRNIIQHPSQVLRERANEVEVDDPQDLHIAQHLAQDLVDTFNHNPMAIGLAANQIGFLQRVIVVDITRRGVDRYVMLNPVIVKETVQTQRVADGCMSVEGGSKRATTKRPLGITVEWRDIDGKPHKQKFRNLIAAVVHHEIEHLDGKLFIDKLSGVQ
jgi:peptide deformylase